MNCWRRILAAMLLFTLLAVSRGALAQDDPPAGPPGITGQEIALAYDPNTQTPALFYDEAMTVYLGNLERR